MYNTNYGFNPYYQPTRFTQPTIQPTIEQPIQNTTSLSTRTFLNGKTVDSIEVVKAIEYPLDGSTSYFPLVDGSAIVTKQLQNDGTSKITVFKPDTEEKAEIKYITKEDMKEALNDIDLSELEDIKDEIKEIKQEIKDLKKKKKED